MKAIDGDRLIDSLESAKRGRGIEVDLVYSLIQEGIRQLPTLSVDDLRPKGRWVEKPRSVLGSVLRYDMVCSECGFDAPTFIDGGCSTVLTKFCHNCGAKMENGKW